MVQSSTPVVCSVQEYFELENASDQRHEYVNGCVRRMLETNIAHNMLLGNLRFALRPGIRRQGCRLYSQSIRLVAQENACYTYPDVIVTCEPADRLDQYQMRHPVLVAEVLSPGTVEYDSVEKFSQYRRMPSLRHYLLISQAAWSVDWFRRDEAGQWIYILLNDPADVLEITDLGLRLPLAELYDDTDVAPLRLTPPVNLEPFV